MFNEEFESIACSAAKKRDLLRKNPMGYFLLSMLAGIFVGFGVLLAFSIGGQLSGAAYTKLAMGASFGVALSLVVMAGAELFTGNNLAMTAGLLKRKVKATDVIAVWAVCYIGNWAGAILLALLFQLTGLNSGAVGQFILSSAEAKMNLGFFELVARGMLCNALVCLAVWCSAKCKSEAGKLIMIFWCLFAFITTGFEHSIANMTLLTAALFSGAGWGGYFYNLLTATLGNMLGGILLVAIPYFVAQREKDKRPPENKL